MKTLLIATTNRSKCAEMRQILEAADLQIELKTLKDFPNAPDVEETGSTFMENAHLKALEAVRETGLISIADDGGLVIDALDGAPGVFSHRFLGIDTSFDDKMTQILEMMAQTPEAQRTCRFVSAVAIATPEGEIFDCIGTCEGRIAYDKKGTFGFGYDPVFLLPELGRHMAELPPEEKHKISHRGRSMQGALTHLKNLFSQ